MRFISLLVSLTTAAIASSALLPRDNGDGDFSVGDNYNAPIPPWERGARPGWYYGDKPNDHNDLYCLTPNVCKNLRKHGFHCPDRRVPVNGYKPTFRDLNGATQAADYLTFGLVETVEDCFAMCNSVQGCGFVNTYHDNNGKNGSPLLTCSLFKDCHDASDAINRGGQSQPNGSIDFITNSDGWCKRH